jgi:3-oxoacyl-[acyl-carrier-protein] synthase II
VPEVAGQVKALRSALKNAGIAPEQIDYVNAHGTSTPPADKTEAASLIEAMGAPGRSVPVSNTKAQLGHLMGATAGVELVTTILAMRTGEIPPCRNLEEQLCVWWHEQCGGVEKICGCRLIEESHEHGNRVTPSN